QQMATDAASAITGSTDAFIYVRDAADEANDSILELTGTLDEFTDPATRSAQRLKEIAEDYAEAMRRLEAELQVTGEQADYLRDQIRLLGRSLVEMILSGNAGTEQFELWQALLHHLREQLAALTDTTEEYADAIDEAGQVLMDTIDEAGQVHDTGGRAEPMPEPEIRRVEVMVPNTVTLKASELFLPKVETILTDIRRALERVGNQITAALLFAAGPLLEGDLAARLQNFTQAASGAGIGLLGPMGGAAATSGSFSQTIQVMLDGRVIAEAIAPQLINELTVQGVIGWAGALGGVGVWQSGFRADRWRRISRHFRFTWTSRTFPSASGAASLRMGGTSG